MKNSHNRSLEKAILHLSQGELIAYPTEAVYGLGCDPFNERSVLKLLALKNRPVDKGLILVAASYSQIDFLIKPIEQSLLERVKASWPGPVTWVFPASTEAPPWVTSSYKTIAVRLTDHPLVQALCTVFDKPIVSTSANPAGLEPAKTSEEVNHYFGEKIAYVLQGALGQLKKPTQIRDALSGDFFRE